MNKLSDLNIIDMVPDSIASDADIQAMAEALTQKLLEINGNISRVLIWDDLSKFDDAILLHLAWQRHVDLYDASLPRATREELIKNSLKWHKVKGTKYAVVYALHTIFQTGTVEEWFEYGGDPYHFRITGLTEPLTDSAKVKKLINVIDLSKNARSWLDLIEFSSTVDSTQYVAGALMEDTEVIISSSFEEAFEFHKDSYVGAAVMDDTEVVIHSMIA